MENNQDEKPQEEISAARVVFMTALIFPALIAAHGVVHEGAHVLAARALGVKAKMNIGMIEGRPHWRSWLPSGECIVDRSTPIKTKLIALAGIMADWTCFLGYAQAATAASQNFILPAFEIAAILCAMVLIPMKATPHNNDAWAFLHGREK